MNRAFFFKQYIISLQCATACKNTDAQNIFLMRDIVYIPYNNGVMHNLVHA